MLVSNESCAEQLSRISTPERDETRDLPDARHLLPAPLPSESQPQPPPLIPRWGA